MGVTIGEMGLGPVDRKPVLDSWSKKFGICQLFQLLKACSASINLVL